MHASFVSPDIFASIKNQLSSGGKDLIIAKIINKVKIALKVLVFIFWLIESKFFIPEYSILIRCKPIKPNIIGKIKLKKSHIIVRCDASNQAQQLKKLKY